MSDRALTSRLRAAAFNKATPEALRDLLAEAAALLSEAQPRERERLRDIVNARLQSCAVSRDRARAAGREMVAECRQSDVETLEWVRDTVLAAPASPPASGERETGTEGGT